MALEKSELYSSLWSSCDELRGGMDASQYKDYVLVLLFIKYVSDKYAGQPYAPITIPAGASFKDMVALKGTSDIGDQINKKIIAPLKDANKLSDMPDFNHPSQLGSGKEVVDRLTNLIAIFENPALDFSREWLVRFVRFVRRWRERKIADYLDIARRTLQDLRAKGLYPPPAPAPDPEAALRLVRKGQAVCLASDLLGERIWIVADQEDADDLSPIIG